MLQKTFPEIEFKLRFTMFENRKRHISCKGDYSQIQEIVGLKVQLFLSGSIYVVLFFFDF